MLSTFMMVSLVMSCGCSDLVRSSSEGADTNRTDIRKDNTVNANSESDIKHRLTRSDVSAALGHRMLLDFWPVRGRRSDSEDSQLPLWTNSERSVTLNSHELFPYWKFGGFREVIAGGRLTVDQPLFAEEPIFILLETRDEQEKLSKDNRNDDTFIVTRGRRQYEEPFASGHGQSFWESLGSLQDLVSGETLSRASRSRRTQSDILQLAKDPFLVARRKRRSFRFLEDVPHSYGAPKHLSGNGPCWSPRDRRSETNGSKNMHNFLTSLSVKEPFSAARGKKESPPMTAASREELLSQIRSRNIQSEADYWQPTKGKRTADTDSNTEDEDYWSALERRTQNKTKVRILTS